jgi:hypothetical protein
MDDHIVDRIMDKAAAVNAWHDDDMIIVSLWIDGEWQDVRLTRDDADQLQGMLYLLVKHDEAEIASR